MPAAMDAGTHAARRPIRVGRRNAEQIAILAGIGPGERIVTSDTGNFAEAATVNIK